jgi:acetyltransferase-like isoleucine patch superfamily enzyme
LGRYVFIGSRAWFSGGKDAPITIGSFVMFGPNVALLCGDHEIYRLGVPMSLIIESDKSPERSGSIIIEDDVWIGANTTILKGVTIGRGAVVAAGSVVNRSVPPFHIAGGVPARVIRERFPKDLLPEHIRQTDIAMSRRK